MTTTRERRSHSRRDGRFTATVIGLLLAGVLITVALPTATGANRRAFKDVHATKAFWHKAKLKTATKRQARPVLRLRADRTRAFTLERSRLAKVLARAPRANSRAARLRPLVVSLPNPNGKFQRFALQRSAIMAPGLARKHPEIRTYRGRGIDDRGATIHADLSPIGFHASVRSPKGAWYIDPYYRNSQSRYVSYYGRDVVNTMGPLVERDASGGEVSVDQGYYHAADTVTLTGSGFGEGAGVTITISDPEEKFAPRTLTAQANNLGSFTASFVADPDGNLETHIVTADDGETSASTSYQVVRDDDPTSDPPTGDVLRTYRLALITDPGYSAYHGGAGNVTAAKVALMNRVDQVYEDDLSITMQLIANNDLLNLNTWNAATAPNGPCGAAACFTQAQVTGCSSTTRARIVIGQIIGASNYDVGHLALGQPGGGVANLGVVGRSNKAGGCTGIPTPIGDFYAIDYVAHEMGHQFSGNHPFNGNQLNCSGGNRNNSTSVEPGSGSSIMAYAGICMTDDLQPHSDPYFSERSLQEISTYTASNQAAINEVQTASLSHFGGGNEQQVVTFGPGYSQAATIQPLSVAIGGVPSATQLGGLDETGNTVTVSTGAAGATHTLQPGDSITISGAANGGYNGTFAVDSVLTSRAFTLTNPTSGLPRSGGGTVTLNAPGLSESGTTVTVRTAAPHGRSVGDNVTISGAGVAAYNGAVTVTAVPTPRSFTYTALAQAPTNITAATNTTGTIATITSAGHGLSVGQQVTIAGVSVAAYNGTWTVASVPNGNTFTVNIGTSGNPAGAGGTATGSNADLPSSGGGSATYFSPFQVQIGGNDSVVVGGAGLPYSNANLTTAINNIAGFAGTATVTGAASTGFTVTYTGASANTDVANIGLANLSCGGCFASVEETNHGGANDSFRLNYNGNVSTLITNGVNYTAAGIQAALLPILPAGATATVAGFGAGGFNNTGFQVTFGGTLGLTNVPVTLALQDFTAGASGFVGETDKGGAVDNKGIVTATNNAIPSVTAPGSFTIPLRTPFALTGNATDADGDELIYSWEQNDQGAAPNAAGTSLLNNTKTNGPLFAMFPQSGQISEEDTLKYDSPGENHLTTSPTRVLPDLQQILDNNTNADSGACPTGPIAPPVSIPVKECFAEFLPTSAYVGAAGVNAAPLSLHFRFTARDNRGGVNSADTTLLLATNAGPFLVSAPNSAVMWRGGSTQTVTWDRANTDIAPTNTANVKISLSSDGGHTYPYVLASSTANDGSEAVTLPNIATTGARIKVEAVGNVFFDVSNADFTIQAVPVVTNSLGEGGSQSVQYSDALSPDVTVTATDDDSHGSDLTANAVGLPAGLSLAIVSTSGSSTLPGSRTWKVAGTTTAAPNTYPVTVTVTDETGGTGTTSFSIVVIPEDADATYVGDSFVSAANGSSGSVLLRATVRDSSLIPSFADAAPGDIRNATVTFKEGATTLCGPLPVTLLNEATTTGGANCTVTLGVGVHTVDTVVNSYYVGSKQAAVEVIAPNGKFVTGSGSLAMGASAGTYKSNSGSSMSFALDAKLKKTYEGSLTIGFRSGTRNYQIQSTALNSIAAVQRNASGASCASGPSSTCFGLADVRATATLTDVTGSPSLVGSGLTLRVTVTDKGSPGRNDSLGVTLWNGGTLLFSSEWTGAATVEKLLSDGNTGVH